MKMTIRITLSEAGQKAQIIAGKDGSSLQDVVVDDTHPRWQRFVTLGNVDSAGNLSSEISNWQKKWDYLPSPEDILAWQDAEAEAKKQEERDESEALQKRSRQLLDRFSQVLVAKETRATRFHAYAEVKIGESRASVAYQPIEEAWPSIPHSLIGSEENFQEITASDDAKAWRQEIDEHNKGLHGAALVVAEKQASESEQERQAALAAIAADRAAKRLEDGDHGYELLGGVMTQSPRWSNEGKNWAARISINPAALGGYDRQFFEKATGRYFYVLPADLAIGDAVEFAAKTERRRGTDDSRLYGYIKRIDGGLLVIRKCEGGDAACTEGLVYRAGQAKAKKRKKKVMQ